MLAFCHLSVAKGQSFNMRTVSLHLLSLFLFSLPLSAQQSTDDNIPDVATVSTKLAQSHPELPRYRDDLLVAVNIFNADATTFNADCGSIDAENKVLISQCSNRLAELQGRKAALIARIKGFNASVDSDGSLPLTHNPHWGKQIGVGAFVRGDVKVTQPDGTELSFKVGDSLALGAHVLTGSDSRLQILLDDETTFTLGPNSDMVLDSFVYDPDASPGKYIAAVTKGSFRFVTAKVAHKDPDHLKVRLNIATIGVRGTDFEVLTQPGQLGYIKLFSGEIDLTLDKDGSKIPMHAGQMIPILPDGNFGTVAPLKGKPTLQ